MVVLVPQFTSASTQENLSNLQKINSSGIPVNCLRPTAMLRDDRSRPRTVPHAMQAPAFRPTIILPGVLTDMPPFNRVREKCGSPASRSCTSKESTRLAGRSILTFLIVISLFASCFNCRTAVAVQPGYDACVEDGGVLQCRDPIQGNPYYTNVDDSFISPGPYSTEGALYSAYLGERYCQQTVTPSPPWSYSLQSASISGGASFETHITHDITRNCDGTPGDHVIEHKTVRKSVSLSCPLGYDTSNTHTANHPLGFCSLPMVACCQRGQLPQLFGNPIDAFGNKVQAEEDYSGNNATALRFVRTYNYHGADWATTR